MSATAFASGLQQEPLTPPFKARRGEVIARLHSVTKRYGQTTALEDLNLSLHPGEVVALLGPNGAGKTTAVRLLLGLTAPTSGSVRVMGRDPRDAEARTSIGAMLQVTRIPETLKVREHIDLFRSYYPAPLSAAEIVHIARIEGLEDRLFGKLSGGQKQRVLFGLALAGNPDLVFLDEPTVGMDIESRRALWDQIRLLSAQGKTVLLTTHYLEEADMLASRIVVINKGSIIAEGTPAEIKHRVAGRRIRCITQLDAALLLRLPSVVSVERDREAVLITAAEAERVVREMLRLDETLHGLEISAPGLEDAFLALTGSDAEKN
ncbi:ABC-2 type transport system ATP-binding protein [Silvibacterium bohemicum]|uniref:ABC-2 type transport system ATP-binding protein n=1 Tax=Silvibacterium bohemicum TaxID=1577686 RepID=A0A841JY74_9BACT|nr:ABC transporter ATP-binding protein [Silvibacterium bohemicum]MBB6143388.1 ABC-2 type transport system ATP-binding protein [Silvibacterium bohemicum]